MVSVHLNTVLQDLQDLKALLGHRDLLGRKDLQDHKDLRVHKGLLARRVLQVNHLQSRSHLDPVRDRSQLRSMVAQTLSRSLVCQ